MAKNKAFLQDKKTNLFIIVPKNYLGEFILAFASKFAISTMDCGLVDHPIDGITFPGTSCRVQLTIEPEEEDRFLAFFREFFQAHSITPLSHI